MRLATPNPALKPVLLLYLLPLPPRLSLSLPLSPSLCQEALAAAETRLSQEKFELELRSIEREMGLQHTIGELQEALAAKVRREKWGCWGGAGDAFTVQCTNSPVSLSACSFPADDPCL